MRESPHTHKCVVCNSEVNWIKTSEDEKLNSPILTN